ncbi:MAG: ABC transporter ATP-binding protein [Acetobacteraceae bacterium]
MSDPATSKHPLLEVGKLCAGYGRSQVLFEVGLRVPQTGAIAVLGRNGVGKTTLLKTIIGELPAMAGHVLLAGRDIIGLRTEQRIRLGLGYVPQEHAVFAKLSVRDNLAVGGLSQRHQAMGEVLSLFPKLGQRLGQAAGTLSGGERKMLAMSRALLLKPRVLLLDEPTEGVWVGVIEEIASRLKQLVREMAVVIVEQHLELALEVADYAYVLDRGRLVLEGPSQIIRNDPQLIQILAP